MKNSRFTKVGILGVVSLALVSGCGLYDFGGGGPTAEVNGNIDDVRPADTGRDIVVFVYRSKGDADDCSNPVLPDQSGSYQSEELQDGVTDFRIKNSQAGRLTIVFLLDEAGRDADGRIDPGDPIAVLNDPDCILDDVPNRYIVTAEDVRINFTDSNANGFPASGRAEAADLFEGPE